MSLQEAMSPQDARGLQEYMAFPVLVIAGMSVCYAAVRRLGSLLAAAMAIVGAWALSQ